MTHPMHHRAARFLTAAAVAVALFTPSLHAETAKATVQIDKDPRAGMTLVNGQVALVVTDPQNDFLDPTGVARGAVGREEGFQVVVVPDATSAAQVSAANRGVHYRTMTVRGVELFYREAGPVDAPVVLLLHGFPTSSHMYRDLIPMLATRYRVIAPDLPGFGESGQPSPDVFDYTFENFTRVVDEFTVALGLPSYALYVMDYGAPVGFRLAMWHPERVRALIIQDANVYLEGIGPFWDPFKAYWAHRTPATRDALRGFLELDAQKWQFQHGVRDPGVISPDTWRMAQAGLDRPGNKEIQLELFYDYRNVLPLYPQLQAYLRDHQPPSLVLWGKHDEIFLVAGALAYKRDLPNAEIHVHDTGHFGLEEEGGPMTEQILTFLGKWLR